MSRNLSWTYEQVTRLHAALGLSELVSTAEQVVAAAETRKRDLERATAGRNLEASRSNEVARLHDEIAGLRADLASRERVARRERELDARDEAEEAAERRRIAEFLKIDPSEVI